MKRIVSYRPTLGETILAILGDIAEGTFKTLYPHPYYHLFCRHSHPRSFYNSMQRLERKNLVGVRLKGGKEVWSLTAAGEKLAEGIKMKINLARHSRWDKKWRLIIFDIPEKTRSRRDCLRKELLNLDFCQLQKSVWVSPYPLPQEFGEIVSELDLGDDYRVVIAESINSDSDIKSRFFPEV